MFLRVESLKKTGLKLFVVNIFMLLVIPSYSQPQYSLTEQLKAEGFENIRVKTIPGKIYIGIENKSYRWVPAMIARAFDIIAQDTDIGTEINLVITENEIPQYTVVVKAADWQDYIQGRTGFHNMMKKMMLTWNSSEIWEAVKKEPVNNPAAGKTDLVVYPQLAYENTQLDQIYEYQLNVAPLIKTSLWKGGTVFGQIIIPLHNELGYEGDFTRPGYVVMEQQFRLKKKWLGCFSAGNFSSNRYGSNIHLFHPLKNENWGIELEAGVTGYSHFYDNRWLHGPVSTLTWEAALSWYLERYDLEFRGGAVQYIYGDKGLFGSLTRYFGETAIQFFAQANQFNYNAGFNVTIPFPIKKRKNRGYINITLPKHTAISYNAGTELYYGRFFYTNPSHNQIKNTKFIQLIKKNILNQKN